MDIKDILSIPFVAFMVFVFVALTMIELGEYKNGAPRPGRELSLLCYQNVGEARSHHEFQHESGPLRQMEVSWK